jgi:hypothetical protein
MESKPRGWLAALVVSLALAGCAIPLSPADLERNENHFYPGRTKGQLFKATTTALKTLGFQIVVSDEAAGKIKTAPKLVTTTAYGSNYSAVATENSIGWNIDVGPAQNGGGAGMHAEPKGYSGGQVLQATDMNGAYLEKLFDTLYGEIDSNLPPAH